MTSSRIGRAERSKLANWSNAFFALLPAGEQDASQNLLCPGTVGRSIATPGFASHGHQTDRPLGKVIRGLQTRTA